MIDKEAEKMLVYVPEGRFVMGTSEEQIRVLALEDSLVRKWVEKNYFDREKPQHRVTLGGYWIAKYPVTVGEFRNFIEASAYRE